MNTTTLEKIQEELDLLRSAIIGVVGKDSEGEYRPAFVRRVLQRAKTSAHYTFTSSEDFLALFKKK